MTVTYGAAAGAYIGISTLVVLESVGMAPETGSPTALLLFGVVVLAIVLGWVYSPLPNDNRGNGQYWGFNRPTEVSD